MVLGIVKGLSKYWYWYWALLRLFMNITIGIGYCQGLIIKLVLGIVKASLKILGIGIGVKKVVLLMSDAFPFRDMVPNL